MLDSLNNKSRLRLGVELNFCLATTLSRSGNWTRQGPIHECGPTNRPLSAPQLIAHTMNAGQIKVVNLYYRLSSSS